jgi:hypothetical protein
LLSVLCLRIRKEPKLLVRSRSEIDVAGPDSNPDP